jgi:hypothetical protein
MSATETDYFLPFTDSNIAIVTEAMKLEEIALAAKTKRDIKAYANALADLEEHFSKAVALANINEYSNSKIIAVDDFGGSSSIRKLADCDNPSPTLVERRLKVLDRIYGLCDYQLTNYINLINEGLFLEKGIEYDPIHNPFPSYHEL